MNCKYIILFSIIILFFGNKNVYSINNKIDNEINVKDSIVKVPILEIQDSSFLYILNKISEYKDKKMEITQEAELFAVIKISYYRIDIYIATISSPFVVLKRTVPKGVISIGKYDYFFYDLYEIVPYLVRVTNSFKHYKYEDVIPCQEEFNTWEFEIYGDEILLKEFYWVEEEVYEDLFFEIFGSGKW